MSKAGGGILDVKISRTPEVSLSALCFLFCEIVKYAFRDADVHRDYSLRLQSLGAAVGARAVELQYLRARSPRETTPKGALRYVAEVIWMLLFGHRAQHGDLPPKDDVPQYYILDNALPLNRFAFPPPDVSLNVGGEVAAGITRSALAAMGFPANVSAHFEGAADAEPAGGSPLRGTVVIVTFV